MASNESTQPTRVFATGYSLRAPASNNPKEFHENLRDGKDMTTESRRYPPGYLGLPPRTGTLPDIDAFDHKFFKFNKKQVDAMDISIRLLLEVTQEALQSARLDIASLEGSKTGVYVGHCFSDFLGRSSREDTKSGYELVNGAHCMAANKLSYMYDLKGPSMVLDTACSSSAVAMDHAFADLRRGVIDRAIVGGVSLTLDPHKNAVFDAYTMLSPDGRCYSFDTRANGYCRSEGIGVVILESDRVGCEAGIAEVLGAGVNSDGFKEKGITYPSELCQSTLMREVMERHNVDPNSIGYIEAHGTGTVAGDAVELRGLAMAFPDQSGCPVGSLKSNMGHAEGASGVLSMIKCLMQYEKKCLFGNLNFEATAHPQLLSGEDNQGPKFKVVTSTRRWEPTNVCINNYGFGGTNGCMILAPGTVEYTDKLTVPDKELPSLVFGSAKSPRAPLPFVLEQASLGNDRMYGGRFLEGGGATVAKSTAHRGGGGPGAKVVFVCNGQGSNWKGMGQVLYGSNETFRSTITRLNGYVDTADLVELYGDGTQWMKKELSTIGIVSYQIGLINCLRELGITPDVVMGHSLGEIVCGYLQGVQTEQQTMQIAELRSGMISQMRPGYDFMVTKESSPHLELFMKNSRGYNIYYWERDADNKAQIPDDGVVYKMTGQMVVVGTSAEAVTAVLEAKGLDQTRVACFNSAFGQTVSGPKDEVEVLLTELKTKDPELFYRTLDTDSVAYHAVYMKDVFFDWIYQKCARIVPGEVVVPAPQVEGPEWIKTAIKPDATHDRISLAEYHTRNIVSPVYFKTSIESLAPGSCIVEIGPNSGLLSQIKRIRADCQLVSLVSTNKEPDDLLAKLWMSGVHIPFVDTRTEKFRNERLPLELRYSNEGVWDHSEKHLIYTHNDFDTANQNQTGALQVKFDLSETGRWKSIRGHCIDNRVLFPATGYIYAFWQCVDFEKVKISGFKIHSPVVIAESDVEVAFEIKPIMDRYTLFHNDTKVAECSVTPLASVRNDGNEEPSGAELQKSLGSVGSFGITANQLYQYIKQHGYLYRDDYLRIDEYYGNFARMKAATDWISYLDGCLHILLMKNEHFALPVSFDSITLSEPDLSKADLYVHHNAGISNSLISNNTVRFEGLFMQPTLKSSTDVGHSVESQAVFFEYGNHPYADLDLLPRGLHAGVGSGTLAVQMRGANNNGEFVKQLTEAFTGMNRESPNAFVLSELNAKEVNNGDFEVVVCDEYYGPNRSPFDHSKLVVTKTNISNGWDDNFRFTRVCSFVNTEGDEMSDVEAVYVYRVESVSGGPAPEVCDSWRCVQERLVKTERDPTGQQVVWKNKACGDGCLSAVKSLILEGYEGVRGYYLEDPLTNTELVGVERQMNINYVTRDRKHGVFIEQPLKSTKVDRTSTTDGLNYHLEIIKPGNLNTLSWVQQPSVSTKGGAGCVQCKVAYSALNFRDVMRAYGKLKERDLSVGLEFSGVNQKGQNVMGISKHTISKHCNAAYSYVLPVDVSLEQGSSILIVYLTVYYALFEKARLKRGQSVLIHAGSGGVGIAAISVCLARGLTVYTTCSSQKRQFIKDTFNLPDNQIGNSRNDSFKYWLLKETNGKGVDAVLNSLSGPLQVKSIECLKPFGSFCEIGKYDLIENTALGQRLFEKNISFHAIDLLPMLMDKSFHQMFDSFLREGFANNEIKPLPTTVFDASKVEDAFRYMSQGKHIGKILIDLQGFSPRVGDILPRYYTHGIHIITGGLGGVALELAKRLSLRGCSKLILVGRSGVKDALQRKQLSKLKCEYEVITGGIAGGGLQKILPFRDSVTQIWHTATSYWDGLFEGMTGEQWDAVCDTKIDGYKEMRKLFPTTPIVCFSSVSSLHGNAGQANYSFANNALECFAIQDPNTRVLQLGAVDNVGQFSSLSEKETEYSKFVPIEVSKVLDFLDTFMCCSAATSRVCANYAVVSSDSSDLASEEISAADIIAMYCKILGGSHDDYSPDIPIKEFGIDSLSTMEIINWINRHSVKQVKPTFITPTTTTKDILKHISNK